VYKFKDSKGGGVLGFDLVAELIQESRSEGIGSYNDFREACGIGRVNNFAGLQDLIRDPSVSIFGLKFVLPMDFFHMD
jgi:hypothetical protein